MENRGNSQTVGDSSTPKKEKRDLSTWRGRMIYICKTQKITHEKLGAILEVSRVQAGAIMRGNSSINIDKLKSFIHGTGVSSDWILFGEGPINRHPPPRSYMKTSYFIQKHHHLAEIDLDLDDQYKLATLLTEKLHALGKEPEEQEVLTLLQFGLKGLINK